MKYVVKINNFEGPFQLLLELVTKQKVDIGSVSITDVIDQFLEQVQHIQQVDLDVATDFMLVAATLLKIKTDMILKLDFSDEENEIEDIGPNEAKEILIQKLLIYKQFKDASRTMQAKEDIQSRMYPRVWGPDPQYLGLMPDFLKGVDANSLAKMACDTLARREEFLLNASHIASKPIPVINYVRTIFTRIVNAKNLKFTDLIDKDASTKVVIVNFLAMLELYKRNYIDIKQDTYKSEILLSYIEGSGDLDIDEDELME